MADYQITHAQTLGSINPLDDIILDVRTRMEHAEKHLSCKHCHVPLDELKPSEFMNRNGPNKDAKLYIVCHSGKRAAQAAEKFVAEGYKNIHVVEGGIIACEKYGQKVSGHKMSTNVGAKSPISLERQVRIAAGAIAGTGALLSLLIHPLFGFIPLFVGGGLIFAGVTDRCGMALILTKAPWNKQIK